MFWYLETKPKPHKTRLQRTQRFYEALHVLIRRSLRCGLKPTATHHQTVAVMVSYDSILCDICKHKVNGEFLGEPNSSPHKMIGAEQPSVSAVAFSSARIFE